MQKSSHNNFKVYFFPQSIRGRSVKEQQRFEHKCPLTLKLGRMVLRKTTLFYNCTNPSKVDQVCMHKFLFALEHHTDGTVGIVGSWAFPNSPINGGGD